MNFDLKNKYAIGLVVAIVLIVASFYVGKNSGERELPILANGSSTDMNLVSKDQFAIFWKAWQVLNDKYVKAASTTPQDKIYGAIQGLASSYGDPYTVFFPPVQSKMFNDDITGDFGGVGMEIGIKDHQLMVIAPLKDSPASKAGVKTGDIILKIGSTTTDGLTADKAVQLIRGPKGTAIDITFLSDGATKPVVRTIIRDTIKIPTLDTEEKDGGIFVIKLYSFTAGSADLFRSALRDFVLSGDDKLILDLRGNPGGYLDAAWDMASWFLPPGKTVVTEDFGANAAPNVFRSKGYNIFNSSLKMLTLVDGGSASASEILAGALDEQGVTKLVGSKTFGKGSVQELIPLTSDTSLKVTVARWLTPKGLNLSENGLDPEYPVSDASSTPQNDLVMNKAIQLLNAQP